LIVFLTVSRGPPASYTNRLIFLTKHTMYRRAHGCRPAAGSKNVDFGPFFIFTKKSVYMIIGASGGAIRARWGSSPREDKEFILGQLVSLKNSYCIHRKPNKIASLTNIEKYQKSSSRCSTHQIDQPSGPSIIVLSGTTKSNNICRRNKYCRLVK
jgi:hypothetical protein